MREQCVSGPFLHRAWERAILASHKEFQGVCHSFTEVCPVSRNWRSKVNPPNVSKDEF